MKHTEIKKSTVIKKVEKNSFNWDHQSGSWRRQIVGSEFMWREFPVFRNSNKDAKADKSSYYHFSRNAFLSFHELLCMKVNSLKSRLLLSSIIFISNVDTKSIESNRMGWTPILLRHT